MFLKQKRTIKIVDFNPFGKVTDSLLFSWEELFDTNWSDHIDFRIIDTNVGIQKSQNCMYGQPIDFLTNIDLCSNIDKLNGIVSSKM